MRPVVLPKMGYWLFPPPLDAKGEAGLAGVFSGTYYPPASCGKSAQCQYINPPRQCRGGEHAKKGALAVLARVSRMGRMDRMYRV